MKWSSLIGVVLGVLLVVPYVAAFGVTMQTLGLHSNGTQYEDFENGFWIVYGMNHTSHAYYTRIINATTNETVLELDYRIGSVVQVESGKGMLVTSMKRYSLMFYRIEDGSYQLIWKLDTRKYGWISYVLPVENEGLILLGTVDTSPNDFGGHYILGIDFNGNLKFATNLHVTGQMVSDIIPVKNREYLVIIPGLGGGTPYLGLIDGSGNIIRSIRIDYPVASNIYIQKHRFIMISWNKKADGYINNIKTYYGIWTLNLTHVATVELPHGLLGASPIFDNSSLYLFTVKKTNTAYNLVEYRYLLNGTLLWTKKVQRLEFGELQGNTGMVTQLVRWVLLPYPNVYVGVHLAGRTVNIVAVDFRNGIPLSSVHLPVVKSPTGYYIFYDAHYLYMWHRVYILNTSGIPSALLVKSNLPANVTVGGAYFGVTPFYVKLKPGKYSLYILRRGYAPLKRVLTVGPHEGIGFFANLTPLNATVLLNSTPLSQVNIVPLGITVDTPSNVSLHNGTYTFVFTPKKYLGQYLTVRRIVTLHPNETLSLNVKLPFIRSKLVVTSNVHNATVYVDDKQVGEIPVQVFVTPGIHNVTVMADGYVSKSIEINATCPILNVSVSLKSLPTSSNMTPYSSASKAPSTSPLSSENRPQQSTHSVCGPGFIVVLTITSLFYIKRRRF